MISPFAASSLRNTDYNEEQVRHFLINTADRIGGKVKLLLDDSFNPAHNLDVIQETLDRIKELAIDEIGDLPRMEALCALWIRLAPTDDYEQYKPHASLLIDMTECYERSSYMMNETIAALNQVEAELSEFRDEPATSRLVLKDYPLEVIISLLRESGQGLEAGKRKLEHIEDGGRP